MSHFTPAGKGLEFAWCKLCGLHRRKHVAPNESCNQERAKLAALARDAGRYRMLRVHGVIVDGQFLSTEKLDEATDVICSKEWRTVSQDRL